MKEKIKNLLTNLRIAFLEWLSLKNIVILLLEFLVTLAGVALFVLVCKKLFNFITANYQLLFLCLSIVLGFAYWAYTIRQKNKVKQNMQSQESQSMTEMREKQHLEDVYSLLQVVLFQAINNTTNVTHIPYLHSPTALESPTHHTMSNGFQVFQYMSTKDSSTCDSLTIREVLNNRIRQALNAGEITGITQTIYIADSGRTYPKIMIDSVKDMGTFLTYDVVIAGEAYASYVERYKTNTTIPFDKSDFDF